MFGAFAAVAGAIHLDEGGDMETQESWMNHPFWADKKDHCVLRYKKALCRQINKQLATQEQICKLFPCPTDACSLRVRPANTLLASLSSIVMLCQRRQQHVPHRCCQCLGRAGGQAAAHTNPVISLLPIAMVQGCLQI